MRKKSYSKSLGVGCIALLCVCSMCFADLTNGDFSTLGLSGWSVDPFGGDVVDGGGYALFVEDPDLMLSSLSQEFNIPALALELSFDVYMSAVPGGDDFGFPPDAFMASLLDPVTFDPLISNSVVTDFYYMDNTGYVETVGTISGYTVILDVWGLGGMDAYLAFDLLGGDDGMITSVSVDNVAISVVPTPSALILGIAGMGTGVLGLRRRFSKSA